MRPVTERDLVVFWSEHESIRREKEDGVAVGTFSPEMENGGGVWVASGWSNERRCVLVKYGYEKKRGRDERLGLRWRGGGDDEAMRRLFLEASPEKTVVGRRDE
ncbi:hypothetical protein HAX54_044652 [Datura stramonium]|uniref:Uncharacterized protein n=1 Tax=Datura stramonium TaxID=4076 RepID=A0ABS8WEZ2_DATST|nr:hypothetical protein [Datura stramonium]